MTKRFKRLRDLDVSLHIKNDGFIDPPRASQKNWLVNGALNEFVDDLTHLDALSKRFAPGSEGVAIEDRTQAELGDEQIMESWQLPLMEAMAGIVTKAHGDVLEVGFGTGASATCIQALGVCSHTIVECNDFVVQRFHAWKERYAAADIRLVHGRWQDVTDKLATYDGVFFHTYPLNEAEYLEYIVQSTTFAEHFLPTAAALLRDSGVLTYLTNEIDSLSRGHQRLLFRHFETITLRVVGSLAVPDDVQDQWWSDSMVVIEAVK